MSHMTTQNDTQSRTAAPSRDGLKVEYTLTGERDCITDYSTTYGPEQI